MDIHSPEKSKPVDAQAMVDSEDLAGRVELALHQLGDPDLCKVCCIAEGGHITLEGIVRTYSQKRMAQTIARHIEGVRTVINAITVPR